MTRDRKRLHLPFLILAGFVCLLSAGIPTVARGEEPGGKPLTMEDLEVRGYREKPDQLYLPVPPKIFHPSPVRVDLFLEDMTRPVTPWQITRHTTAKRGEGDDGYAPDRGIEKD
jgi:hypothetical protein